MKYLKKILRVAVLLLLIFAALHLIPLRRNIDMNIPCMLWNQSDAGELEGMEIKGVYYDYLIRNDRFKGTVRISEVNAQDEMSGGMELEFRRAYGSKYSSMIYIRNGKSVIMGTMYMRGVFDKVYINLHMANDSPLNGMSVVAPALTLEEAKNIAKEMNFA